MGIVNLESKLFGVKLEKMNRRKLITAALPYINALPHLGNIVGSHLPADIFARYSRLVGDKVLFVGGSDEHGTPIEISAEQIGIPIEVFKEEIHKKHKEIYEWFNFSYDNYSRTSTEIHKVVTQEFFQQIYKNGFISEGELEQFYSEKEGRFLPDRYIVGRCPKCNYEEANGDQCEECGTMLDPKDLIDSKSRFSGDRPIVRKSKHLFLDLNKIEEKLKTWITDKAILKSQVRNLALGWMRDGLNRRCITRDNKNGVPVPLAGYEEKVFYVWFDAPIGYISATKEIDEHWEAFWKSKDSEIVHFLGKDNIPFHTIFWPGMIIANGNYKLPTQVVGLQYLKYEGRKFSKSKNRGVFCEHLLTSDLDSDLLRGYLVSIIPETGDSSFDWKGFQTKVNSEIIGTYGNFINRNLGFVNTRFGGKLRKPEEFELDAVDKNFLEKVGVGIDKVYQNFDSIDLRNALKGIYEIAAEGNRYFDETAPWRKIKENPKEVEKVVYLCSSVARSLSIMMFPFMPNSSEKIWKQLNLEGKVDDLGNWYTLKGFHIPDIHQIGENRPLFKKMEDSEVLAYKKKLSQASDLKDFFS